MTLLCGPWGPYNAWPNNAQPDNDRLIMTSTLIIIGDYFVIARIYKYPSVDARDLDDSCLVRTVRVVTYFIIIRRCYKII